MAKQSWPSRAGPSVFVALAGFMLIFAWTPAPVASRIDWQPLEIEQFRESIGKGRPVLLEFTADWCINCKVLERTVYADPTVIQAIHEAGVLSLQADLTEPDTRIEQLLTAMGGTGLPFTLIFDGQGQVVHKLSNIFTAAALKSAIQTATDAND